MKQNQSIGPTLRDYWRRFSATAAGRWAFSRFLACYIPYTGSIGATIDRLEPGYCKVRLKDRRGVRNHLRSIHAIALCNLGEMATGLALNNSLPEQARSILTSFSIDYLIKARGTLTAECRCPIPADRQSRDYVLEATICDQSAKIVAKVQATWRVGPIDRAANDES